MPGASEPRARARAETQRELLRRFPETRHPNDPNIVLAYAGCGCPSCESQRRRYGRTAPAPAQSAYSLDPDGGRRFGVEIECLVPADKVRPFIRRYGLDEYAAMARMLRTRTRQCRSGGFRHGSWGVKHDGSITGPAGYYRFEIVSPPLQGEAGIKEVESVMRRLQRIGASVNRSCGFHVHVEANTLTEIERRNIARNFIWYEDVFDSVMPSSRRLNNSDYCRSNRYRCGNIDIFNDTDMAQVKHMMLKLGLDRVADVISYASGGHDKYVKLNFRHLSGVYGTLEFRQHSGTINPVKARYWIECVTHFVEVGRKKKINPLVERPMGPKERLEQFMADFKLGRGARAYLRDRFAKFTLDPRNADAEAAAGADAVAAQDIPQRRRAAA